MKFLSESGGLGSRLKRWRRKHRQTLLSSVTPPFFHAQDIEAVRDYFAAKNVDMDNLPESPQGLNGRCFICAEDVEFRVEYPADGGPVNWRETLSCPQCKLINRWRSCLHLFETLCDPVPQDHVYLTEVLSPVYQQLVKCFPLLCASEFSPQAEPGSTLNIRGQSVRNEDVTSLTYKDRSFDSVLCFDVLEHVPDYRAALGEFCRVLSRGGILILSVPFSFKEETVVRAELDGAGNVSHLVEPCYHGDPLSDQGVLSYYDFGMALLNELKQAGFRDSFLVCYESLEWGYLDPNIAFVAHK